MVNMNLISLFSGAGGLDKGFHKAGFKRFLELNNFEGLAFFFGIIKGELCSL